MPKASKPSPRTTTARKRSASPTAPTQGRADLARLRRTTEVEIARTAPAELRDIPEDFWQGARVVTAVRRHQEQQLLGQDAAVFEHVVGQEGQQHAAKGQAHGLARQGGQQVEVAAGAGGDPEVMQMPVVERAHSTVSFSSLRFFRMIIQLYSTCQYKETAVSWPFI